MPYRPVELLVLLPVMLAYTGLMPWIFLRLFRGFKQKELRQQRQLLETTFQGEKALYEAKQEIQEETFKQISRELHDNVGQTFSLAKLGLANLTFDDPREASATVLEITDIMAKGIADLRDISSSLNAELVRTRGLRKAIGTQLGFIERTGRYQVSFDFPEDLASLDAPTEIIFYRILQESLNNIIRHAKASEIKIQLSKANHQLQLCVQDNGVGFDSTSVMADDFRKGRTFN